MNPGDISLGAAILSPLCKPGMDLITTTEELATTCERLARHPFVTIDTEFLRETTYYPLLCVAQLASSDEAVVIDALAPDIDLKPFFELMANEKVLKVFHAARQDIEIVWHRANIIPHPIFDTQVAAMVLGHGDSISYDQLVQRITGDTLDKSNRFTDWTRRPLSTAQVTYAISDVTHLRDVYTALVADLGRRGRTDWMDDEMEVLTSPDTYRAEPGRAWMRLKTRVRKPKELAVLIEVAAWREREAQTRDVPRSRVLKDDTIGDIATQAPTTAERLAEVAHAHQDPSRRLRGVEGRGLRGESVQDLVGLVRDAQQVGEAEALGLAQQGRVQPGVVAVVPAVEEHHGAPAEHLVGVLGGVLEDLLHGPRVPGREDDAAGGDREQPVLADAVGEVLGDVRGELADRLALVRPRRDGEALGPRREPLPDPDRDLEVAGLVRGVSGRVGEGLHGLVALVA